MIIAIDIDDVLCPTMQASNDWFNRFEGTNHSIDEYVIPRYDVVWTQHGYTDEQLFPIFDKSKEFRSMKPFPEALEVVNRLKKTHELHVITARIIELEKLTFKWLDKYFPGVFKSITMTNHDWSSKEQQLTKLQVCERLGAQVIVEDNPYFAVECADDGIPCIIMDRPWNRQKNVREHKNVFAAQSWGEVEKLIERIDGEIEPGTKTSN